MWCERIWDVNELKLFFLTCTYISGDHCLCVLCRSMVSYFNLKFFSPYSPNITYPTPTTWRISKHQIVKRKWPKQPSICHMDRDDWEGKNSRIKGKSFFSWVQYFKRKIYLFFGVSIWLICIWINAFLYIHVYYI